MARGATARSRRTARRAKERNARGVGKAPDAAHSLLTAGASGKTGLPLSDRDAAWDAAAAEASLDEGQYPDAHFWRDPDGDPATLAAYKLPFARSGPPLTAVWRGVTASAGALMGARGGVKIPQDDVAAVRTRIGGYYAAAREAYDDPEIREPWEEATLLSPAEMAHRLAYAEAVTGSDYQAGLADWTSALTPPDRTDVLSEFDRNLELQYTPACECRHPLSEHLGGDGPCTHEDGRGRCSCGSFAELRVEGTAPAAVLQAESECVCGHMPMQHDGGVGECAVAGCDCEMYRPAGEAVAATVTLTVTQAEALAEETLPAPNPSPTIDVQPQTGPPVKRWQAILAPEGKLTDDGRAFAPGSISWRDLPLTLMAQLETQEGHEGARVAGRIDRIWRAGGLIMGTGVFDDSEFGREIARMVDDRVLRGISVDIAVVQAETGSVSDYFDEDGAWIHDREQPEPEAEEEGGLLDILYEESVFVVTEGVIGATTVVSFPAFADAEISLVAGATCRATMQAAFVIVDQPRPEGSLTAAVAAAPLAPPSGWFADPLLTEPTPLTVTDDGRVYGHAALWDTCHTGIPAVCTTPPRSQSGYAYFLLKEVECEGGERIGCGTITLDTGHADLSLGRVAATAHYDNTGTAVADVTVGEDEHGIWFAGALRPDVAASAVRTLRGAVPSGDWRAVNGDRELVAILAVNVPGFPVPRAPRALLAAADGAMRVLSVVAAGLPLATRAAALDSAEPGDDDEVLHLETAGIDEQAALDAVVALARSPLPDVPE